MWTLTIVAGSLPCIVPILRMHASASTVYCCVQVDFIVAFLGVTYARAVAAPLNPNYKLVNKSAALTCTCLFQQISSPQAPQTSITDLPILILTG